MSSLNDEEVLITFEELKDLQIKDISLCVDKYNALSICEKSSAPPCDTYNLWVQKLFKAYDTEEFSSNDWHKIIGYLENVLNNFVQNVDSLDDNSLKQLNLWWSDTQELLQWLESIINTLDVCVLSLILTFVLEVIMKTCKFTNKGNLKPIFTIQQLVVSTINNFMFPMPIQNEDDFKGFNKVLSSLCDVGALISSADIKTSIETWRVVAKLSGMCNSTISSDIQSESTKNLQCDWLKKSIFGILNELTNILKSILDANSCSNNDNILQVAQFYLKLLKVIINHSSDKICEFPAIKELFELYTLCNHQLAMHYKSKIDMFINKDLYEIFSLIQHQSQFKESILQHFQRDMLDFNSCDLILNYLQKIIEKSQKDLTKYMPVTDELLDIYNILFEGPLIFIDGDKYSKSLEYYVALTILDVTNELHMKLCHYVMDSSSWMKAYTSAEILRIYYSYIFKNQPTKNNLSCLEFWLQIWNKCNNCMPEMSTQKILIELVLKTIIRKIPDAIISQQYSHNLEIIMLISDKENHQLLQYFNTNLIENLTRMQKFQINKNEYRELINLLEICILKPTRINFSLRIQFIKTFKALLSIPPLEIHKFREFLNKCFRIFIKLDDSNINNNILHCLKDNLTHVENMWSVFLIEYLLKLTPKSTELLNNLKSLELNNIRNLMECKISPIAKKPIDLKVFQNLSQHYKSSNTYYNTNELSQITKKPRLGECHFSNIKFILNEINLHTQHLMKIDSKLMDSNDVELLNFIKNNIDKCLTK